VTGTGDRPSLPRAEIGMTVTTADDEVSRRLEVHAPFASRRLHTRHPHLRVRRPHEPDEVPEAYVQARTKEHREQLGAIVAGLPAEHGLRLRFDEVVRHDDNDALCARPAGSA
jgi:hypothetical protein